MTTKVKIEAHTADNIEVKVALTDSVSDGETFTLQNGESAERYVYGGRVISVQEVEKL